MLGAALDALWGGAPRAKPCKPDDHEAGFIEELEAALASSAEGQSRSRHDLARGESFGSSLVRGDSFAASVNRKRRSYNRLECHKMHEELNAFKNTFFEEYQTRRGWKKAWLAAQGWDAMVPSEQHKLSLAMRAALNAGKKGQEHACKGLRAKCWWKIVAPAARKRKRGGGRTCLNESLVAG